MFLYTIRLIFITFLLRTYGEVLVYEGLIPDFPVIARSAKSSFDAQFHRGHCPDYFYQINNECVYFDTNGRNYKWNHIEPLCTHQIARLLTRQMPSITDQSNLQPTGGVRQFILNTPEKTKILEALYREYDELNYAVRLPVDYNSLTRCSDRQEDHLPQFCQKPKNTTDACFETSGIGFDHICLRQIDCDTDLIRFACEFTLPGNSELSGSKFRTCPDTDTIRVRLSPWAWVLVAVGAMLFLLLLLGGFLAFMRNSKAESAKRKKSQTTISQSEKQDARTSFTRQDTLIEPMLPQNCLLYEPDSEYLEPTTTRLASLPNLTTVVKENGGDAYI